MTPRRGNIYLLSPHDAAQLERVLGDNVAERRCLRAVARALAEFAAWLSRAGRWIRAG